MACGFESRPRYQIYEVYMELSTIYIIMAVVAIISLYFGRKIALQSIEESLMRKAFEEAKREYLDYFHQRFSNNAESVNGLIIDRQRQEIERLTAEVNLLRSKLEGKK